MPVSIIGAMLLTAAGAFLLYAGSRNQRLFAASRPAGPMRLAGGAALLASLALMWTWFGRAAAVFAWATLAMLIWSVVPLAVAWWRRPRGNAE
jgi:hypothetical protein